MQVSPDGIDRRLCPRLHKLEPETDGLVVTGLSVIMDHAHMIVHHPIQGTFGVTALVFFNSDWTEHATCPGHYIALSPAYIVMLPQMAQLVDETEPEPVIALYAVGDLGYLSDEGK